MVVEMDLGGLFEYVVVDDNLVLVDPKWAEKCKELISK